VTAPALKPVPAPVPAPATVPEEVIDLTMDSDGEATPQTAAQERKRPAEPESEKAPLDPFQPIKLEDLERFEPNGLVRSKLATLLEITASSKMYAARTSKDCLELFKRKLVPTPTHTLLFSTALAGGELSEALKANKAHWPSKFLLIKLPSEPAPEDASEPKPAKIGAVDGLKFLHNWTFTDRTGPVEQRISYQLYRAMGKKEQKTKKSEQVDVKTPSTLASAANKFISTFQSFQPDKILCRALILATSFGSKSELRVLRTPEDVERWRNEHKSFSHVVFIDSAKLPDDIGVLAVQRNVAWVLVDNSLWTGYAWQTPPPERGRTGAIEALFTHGGAAYRVLEVGLPQSYHKVQFPAAAGNLNLLEPPIKNYMLPSGAAA
jgi:hypothetical protein